MKMRPHLPNVAVLVALAAAATGAAACSGAVSLPLAGRVQVTAGQSGVTATSHQPVVAVPPSAGSAAGLQSQFVAVVKKVGPSVVQVETPAGLGSGVVYDAAGDIVTNAHVVGSYSSFTITTASGTQATARLVGVDAGHDLAVIRTPAPGLPPAVFADSSALEVGDVVLALGSPFGLRGSVTQGLVSSLGRQVAESRRVTLTGLIQTSAPINPGNSGGALVDLAGSVVGIPTLGATGGDGIGFAISSATVLQVAPSLIGHAA